MVRAVCLTVLYGLMTLTLDFKANCCKKKYHRKMNAD